MPNQNLHICVIDDEDIVRITISDELKEAGYKVNNFGDPTDAVRYISINKPDVVLTDFKMPKLNGAEVLAKVKEISPNTHVIIMTAFGSVSAAIEAIKLGAFHYLIKPFKHTELENSLKKIKEIQALKNSNIEYQKLFKNRYHIDNMWGESDAMKTVRESVELVAKSNTNILITGETGSGKEVLANTIHYSSNRAKKPLIKVSCAILSPDIIESELFGHEKGSFTGADKPRIGRFEEANEGTIYLDDIDDIPLHLQVKLLRVLQENEIEKVGSSKAIKIDVRVISSTKVDLFKLVSEGKFREDLYYRLNVFPISMPPLRERKSDIKYLINKFIMHLSENKKIFVNEDVYNILENYSWPGNVRELKNFVERSIILARDGIISKKILPMEFCVLDNLRIDLKNNKLSLPEILSNFEKNILLQALELSTGNKNKAAELLNIPITTLRSKLEKQNI